MDFDVYKNKITIISNSMLIGQTESEYTVEEIKSMFKKTGIIGAFLEDDDIQEITVCSSNIGFVKTFRKEYKGKE